MVSFAVRLFFFNLLKLNPFLVVTKREISSINNYNYTRSSYIQNINISTNSKKTNTEDCQIEKQQKNQIDNIDYFYLLNISSNPHHQQQPHHEVFSSQLLSNSMVRNGREKSTQIQQLNFHYFGQPVEFIQQPFQQLDMLSTTHNKEKAETDTSVNSTAPASVDHTVDTTRFSSISCAKRSIRSVRIHHWQRLRSEIGLNNRQCGIYLKMYREKHKRNKYNKKHI